MVQEWPLTGRDVEGFNGVDRLLLMLRHLPQKTLLAASAPVLWFWAKKYQVKNFRAFMHDVLAIHRSGLFFAEYYQGIPKGARSTPSFFSQIGPIAHFLEIGAKESLDPNPLFSVNFYLTAYPDVRKVKVNPLLHYIFHGGKEARSTHPLFDANFYQKQIPGGTAERDTPLGDFLHNGASGQRDPCLLFDTKYYLSQSPELSAHFNNPLIHYLHAGAQSGFDPHRYFSSSYYLEHYSNKMPEEMNPLEFFLRVGGHKGHHPSPSFDTTYYLEVNPDIGDAGVIPLVHYLEFGHLERRQRADFYSQWITQLDRARSSQGDHTEEIARMAYQPRFSVILPAFNTDKELLAATIQSVVEQVYPHWELCVANDGSTASHVGPMLDEYQSRDSRIRVIHRSQTGHISAASNSALSLATGDFIALLDHDDLLDRFALLENARTLNANPQAKILYSDEDKINQKGRRYEPFFKPDWSPELLLSQMYSGHLGVYRRDLIEEIGGFREGYEGSQDFDLMLRASELTDKIAHIPHVLYHWQTVEGSTAGDPKAKEYAYVSGQKALQDAANRRGLNATSYRIPKMYGQYALEFKTSAAPKVSVLIPILDLEPGVAQIATLILSIGLLIDYPDYEIVLIVADVGAASKAAVLLEDVRTRVLETSPTFLAESAGLRFDELVRFVVSDISPNYARQVNVGIDNSDGEFILCLDSLFQRMNVLYGGQKNFLDQMVGYMSVKEVGAIGGLIVDDSSGAVVSAGLMTDTKAVVADMHYGEAIASAGYFGRLVIPSNCTAVRLGCLLTRRSLIEQRGGFKEDMPVQLAALDYGLWLRDNNLRSVMMPQFRFFQKRTSAERPRRDAKQHKSGQKAREQFLEKWGASFPEVDPYYNPNLKVVEYELEYGSDKGRAARFDLDVSAADVESSTVSSI